MPDKRVPGGFVKEVRAVSGGESEAALFRTDTPPELQFINRRLQRFRLFLRTDVRKGEKEKNKISVQFLDLKVSLW